MPSAVVYLRQHQLADRRVGAERLGGGAARLLRGGVEQTSASISGPIRYGASASCCEPEERSCSAIGGDRALLVERGGHHRHGEARGQQHAGDPGGLHGLLAAHGGQDDAVRGGGHGEQPGAVGARQTGLGQPHVQRLGEQRVRAEDIGQLGRDAAVHDGLADPAQQRAVRTGEQRHDDGGGALGRGLTSTAGGRAPARSGRCAPAAACASTDCSVGYSASSPSR